MNPSVPAISVKHLFKTFTSQTSREKIKAVDDISLEVPQGQILGLLGPNGAGKTTLLNILSTLLLPDSGTVEILGVRSTPKNFKILRTLLNMSSGYPNYPWSLTVVENLQFYGRLYGLSRKELDRKITKLVEMFGLGDYADRRFEELSSGTKQKLSLAKALLNDPKIIFLDEPTVGLDPDVSIKTREIILNIIKNTKVTVLLTTHNMNEAELMCQRIAFIKQGRILKLASPQELKQAQGKKDLEEVFVELARHSPAASRPDKVSVASGENKPTTVIDRAALGLAPTNVFNEVYQWFNRTLAFTRRNFIFAIRNVFAFMELLFWPVVSLISIGLMGDFLQLQEKAFAFVMTGVITAGVLQVAQLDVAYSLLYEVWSKSMKHTLLTPVGVAESMAGSWLVGIVRGSVIFMVLGAWAVYGFGFKFPALAVTAVFLLGIFGCAFLLGLLVNILILMFGQKAEITAWMFAYIFMLLSGIYYPIDTLPHVFYMTAQWVPIAYFLEYFRQSFGFTPVLDHLLLKGFGLILLYLVIGLWAMKAAFHQARRKGIIVRLSE